MIKANPLQSEIVRSGKKAEHVLICIIAGWFSAKILIVFHCMRHNFDHFVVAGDKFCPYFIAGGQILRAPLGAPWAGSPGANDAFTSPKKPPLITTNICSSYSAAYASARLCSCSSAALGASPFKISAL
jgi:hypothetical protein